MIVKLQDGSVSAAIRRMIWCFIVGKWYNSFTVINKNVVVDGKKACIYVF